jgi:hypothetical protein
MCCQSVDSVLDTVMSCDRLLATLPSVRWAEAIFSLTSQLLDACVTFMAEHFSGVLTSDRYDIPSINSPVCQKKFVFYCFSSSITLQELENLENQIIGWGKEGVMKKL